METLKLQQKTKVKSWTYDLCDLCEVWQSTRPQRAQIWHFRIEVTCLPYHSIPRSDKAEILRKKTTILPAHVKQETSKNV